MGAELADDRAAAARVVDPVVAPTPTDVPTTGSGRLRAVGANGGSPSAARTPSTERGVHDHHLAEALRAAALQAERETGVREETDDAARASLVVRAARISAGTIVTLLGLALLVLPGPGIVVLAAGLSILAIDVPFARRLLKRVRDRLPEDADGGLPNWLLVSGGAGLVLGVGASVALMLR